MFWFEWHGFDYPDSRKLADSARVLCAPPAFVVALSVTVANVTAVPPSWPHLLAGLHVVARTQLLPKAAMIGLDVTCGVSGADAGTTTRLRPDSGPAEVPAYIEGAPTPGLAPGSPGRAAYQGLKPGQDSSQQPTVTLPGALTVDAADSTTYAYRSAGPGLQIEGFSRMATVAGTWGWVTNASYPEPRSLVSAADGGAAEADAAYYGDYGENADLHADVTWVDVCPRRTRVVGVEVRGPAPACPRRLRHTHAGMPTLLQAACSGLHGVKAARRPRRGLVRRWPSHMDAMCRRTY